MENKEDTSKMNDHDLLVTMHEQLKNVRIDIQDLKEGTSIKLGDHESRIRILELLKADAVDVKWLQRIAYTGLGILAGVQFYFNYIHQ